VKASAVRVLRRPRRIATDARDVELAALVANVPGAIYRCAIDADWTMAMISDEIERISGHPAADFVGSARRTFASVIHPDDRAEVDRQVMAAIDADRPFALEYRITRADGTVAWVLERGQRVAGAGDEACLHGVIFDVTERKRAEDRLRGHEAEQARLDELRAARARIVAAADAARREIERNLHDGAQQRLVTLALTLRLARASVERDPAAAAALLDDAVEALAEATAELRELARGIHPALLTHKGLHAAVAGLADRAPLPVDVDCALRERLPASVEATAYFVVAESLTNVARYAGATRARVRLAREADDVVVEIADDGVGGVDTEAGSGLRGLADRVEALDGVLDVASTRGRGTRVRATIPVAAAP
jgi:PAS domain S-box-containing protein